MDKNKSTENNISKPLIFNSQDGKNSIEVRWKNETFWLTEELMGELFLVGTNSIKHHLKEAFKSGEIDKNSVVANFAIAAKDKTNHPLKYYNLDAIISIGYRINPVRATQFRQWTTKLLINYFVNNKNCLDKPFSTKENYNRIEITGKALIPGFSIYLMELKYESEKFYYLGMTGDNYYPSARAAFHRISGHLELAKRSTQNQLMIALKDKDFSDLYITMHHFPIDGFEVWKGSEKISKFDSGSDEYKKYKNRQTKIRKLEDAIISLLSKENGIELLNKTDGKESEIEGEFKGIADSILQIVREGGDNE